MEEVRGSGEQQLLRDVWPVARPAAHFMSLAPLDVWGRVLLSHPPSLKTMPLRSIEPRYYLRLASLLGTSVFGTLITLPERILFPALTMRPPIDNVGHRGRAAVVDHPPGALAILGYYRTGTTHLQYLLSCDPNLATPRFAQVMAPHGFFFSWIFLRLFLIPFLSTRRPQDDVAIGPEWPAEDDFATCNFNGSSSLIGRLVFPSQFVSHSDFDYRCLSEERLCRRWMRAEAAFLQRMSALHPSKRLLLKTPSHTWRARRLQALFSAAGGGGGGDDDACPNSDSPVRFIHISRDPEDVVRSNLNMFKRLGMYRLEDLPSDEALTARIEEEYATFEQAYRDACARGEIAAGHTADIRYEDLRADPIGVVRGAYEHLGLPWSEFFEQRMGRYLHSVRDYEPGVRKEGRRIQDKDPDIFSIKAVSGSIVCAVLVGLIWGGYVRLTFDNSAYFVWLAGIAIGYVTLRLTRAGSRRLGLWAAGLTLLVHLTVAIPNVRSAYYRRYDPTRQHVLWSELVESARQELLASQTIFWMVMGLLTAYRFASRGEVKAPGE